ncbi:uncharacterized protein LOC129593689 [Paramacrobiotus metropolitanus]|uniref:uncharacterized protein LOC129593689 n=1 Tax=Paramacrobiotus metropolitanus TaxID=2943436 RepID=UPI002445F3E3|nr:uncharacterized protein LOC129593689 [Paramacrobiotus metropolitanus]
MASYANNSSVEFNATIQSAPWNQPMFTFSMTNGIKIWLIVFAIVCGMGTILNGLIFFAVVTQRSLQTGSGWLIAHKQFLDGLICGVVFPLITSPVLNFWLGNALPAFDCDFLIFHQLLLMQVGYWVALFLGVNRFVALLLPHSYSRVSNRRMLGVFFALSWIIAISSQLPGVLGFGLLSGVSPFLICSTLQTLGVLYVTIFAFVWRRRRRIANEGAPGLSREVYDKKYAMAKLLFASYIWNTVCSQLPIILLLLIPPRMRVGPLMAYWMRTVVVCEYAANPVFFFALSRDYRNGCGKLLRMLLDTPAKVLGACLLYLGNKLVNHGQKPPDDGKNSSSGSRSATQRTAAVQQ